MKKQLNFFLRGRVQDDTDDKDWDSNSDYHDTHPSCPYTDTGIVGYWDSDPDGTVSG